MSGYQGAHQQIEAFHSAKEPSANFGSDFMAWWMALAKALRFFSRNLSSHSCSTSLMAVDLYSLWGGGCGPAIACSWLVLATTRRATAHQPSWSSSRWIQAAQQHVDSNIDCQHDNCMHQCLLSAFGEEQGCWEEHQSQMLICAPFYGASKSSKIPNAL